MFEAVLKSGECFKKLIDVVKDIVSEANLECNEKGITLQAMDSSHISLVSFFLEKDEFESYKCTEDISLGLNMANLSKILRCSNKNDKITLKCTNLEKLSFLFKSSEKKSEFHLKLMDIESENLGIPEQDYDVEIKMNSSEFTNICRDLQTLGDSIQIKVHPKEAIFSSSGDIGDGSITLEKNKETNIKLADPDSEISLSFALKYLMLFAKAATLSDKITLRMGPEVPLSIEYKMTEVSKICYYLAPKIEDEIQ